MTSGVAAEYPTDVVGSSPVSGSGESSRQVFDDDGWVQRVNGRAKFCMVISPAPVLVVLSVELERMVASREYP